MINFLRDGLGRIVDMFLSWLGILNGAARDVSERSAGAVLTVIALLALVGAAASFIVSVFVRVVSAVSFDSVPLMNHVNGHIRQGIGQVRDSYWLGFWRGVYFTRAKKRMSARKKAAAKKKKKVAAGKPLPEDQFRPIHEGTSADLPWASYEIGTDAPGQAIDYSGHAGLPPVASVAMSLTSSGVLLGKYVPKTMAGVKAKKEKGEIAMQDGASDSSQIVDPQGQVHNRVSEDWYGPPTGAPVGGVQGLDVTEMIQGDDGIWQKKE